MSSEAQSQLQSLPSIELPSAKRSIVDRAVNSHSVWSTNGGPPLILVFVATGLLVAALACLAVLRRLDARRGRGPHPPLEIYRNVWGEGQEERPRLWDVRLAPCTITDQDGAWDETVVGASRYLALTVGFDCSAYVAHICKAGAFASSLFPEWGCISADRRLSVMDAKICPVYPDSIAQHP